MDQEYGGSDKVITLSEEKTKSANEREPEGQKENIFLAEEITIEEMAIDGICGVY